MSPSPSLARELEVARAFAASLPWREPWFVGLLAAEAALLAAVVACRRRQAVQVAVLGVVFAVVRGGERLNRELGARWRSFASADVFDEAGAFFAATVAAPLLGVMAVQVVRKEERGGGGERGKVIANRSNQSPPSSSPSPLQMLQLTTAARLMVRLKAAQIRAGRRKRA